MDPAATVPFGRTGIPVTALGFGAAPIGNFLKAIAEAEVQAMVDAAWDAGLRYFDTAPLYGHGLSELRLGHALRGRPRDAYVLSTKVGYLLQRPPRGPASTRPWVDVPPFERVYDYGFDGTLRSIEDSLQRLGTDHIDIAFIHDVDVINHGAERQAAHFATAMDGAWRALLRLRDEGAVRAIGVGVNEWEVCEAALRAHDFDGFLLAGQYSLLQQGALDSFLPLCIDRGAAVVLGGGFHGGILATGAVPGAKYDYAPAPEAVMARVRRIEAVCARHGVSLKAAALQFLVAHPAIPTVIPGTRTEAQMHANLEAFTAPIPAELWAELKADGLLREDAPTPA
jgi:D-threo-aldose 1-dehydrogenase